jgi:hypothetical protein
MKKTFLFIMFSLLFAGILFAQQNIKFAYDPAGNCISRTIVLNAPSRAPVEDPIEDPQIDTETEEEAAPNPTFVEQLAADLQLKIYPNPTQGLLQVEIIGNENDNITQIAVFNQNGQQIIATQSSGQLTPVDMSSFPAGTYILRLGIGERIENYTIIKK